MRALVLGLSFLAIVTSTQIAEAGLTTTVREQSASADTATITEETNQETENKIGLNKAKRREIQRALTRLGLETKASGKFDESTRRSITRWQEEYGYPKTGFLTVDESTTLIEKSPAEGKSAHHETRRGGGGSRSAHGIGGPIGAIGHVVGGLFRF